MDTGLIQAAGAMRSGEQRLDTIAHNLANVSTRGFKRASSFTQALMNRRTRTTEIATGFAPDVSQGLVETTGNPFDLALDGPGWFAIDDQSGRTFTRDGGFRVDDRGTLVTQDGAPVAWKGARGTLRPTGEVPTIASDGTVRQGSTTIGQLDVVDFESDSGLQPTGKGRWTAPADAVEKPATGRVLQGSSERSNVEAMDELVELVSVQRSFESAATTLRTIEESYRRLNQPR